jgi:benzil reductase ((S)-benzoin forming)
MSKTYIITGVSRGIGKALAEHFLSKNHAVIGIGRAHSIQNPNFHFLELDLLDVHSIQHLQLPTIESEEIILINNAGIIGNIERISSMKEDCINEIMQVNVIAPIQLTRKISEFCGHEKLFTLVNISSGAGKRPIPSWAGYCASKAAIDLFSQTFLLEERELGKATKVYSVSPGVIDTDMQIQIRSTDEKAFSSLENFQNLKSENKLETPERIALKLNKLLSFDYGDEVIFSLNELII